MIYLLSIFFTSIQTFILSLVNQKDLKYHTKTGYSLVRHVCVFRNAMLTPLTKNNIRTKHVFVIYIKIKLTFPIETSG